MVEHIPPADEARKRYIQRIDALELEKSKLEAIIFKMRNCGNCSKNCDPFSIETVYCKMHNYPDWIGE